MLARFGAGGRPGMAALTEILARAEIDYAHLPYDGEVLNRALAARARGEKIFLVAERFAGHAAGVAAHLGLTASSRRPTSPRVPICRSIAPRSSASVAQPQPRQL